MSPESSPLAPKHLQQEKALGQELKSFIDTLPKHTGWNPYDLFQYKGFWFPPRYLQGVIFCERGFQPKDSDILLATCPKSGTTWMKALLFTLVNRNRYPIDANHPLFSANSHDLIPTLEIVLYSENQNPDLSAYSSPRLFSTHMPWVALPEPVKNGSKCKIVCMGRNPKDVFVSSLHYANKLRTQEKGINLLAEIFEIFCEGVSPYGPVWDHILDYWKQSQENPDKVFFLKYEDMKEQPEKYLRRLAEFLDCPFSPGEEKSGVVEEILKFCSFENLSNLEINKNGKLVYCGVENSSFFRKGEAGDWKNHLSDEMAQKMDSITEEKLGESGIFHH